MSGISRLGQIGGAKKDEATQKEKETPRRYLVDSNRAHLTSREASRVGRYIKPGVSGRKESVKGVSTLPRVGAGSKRAFVEDSDDDDLVIISPKKSTSSMAKEGQSQESRKKASVLGRANVGKGVSLGSSSSSLSQLRTTSTSFSSGSSLLKASNIPYKRSNPWDSIEYEMSRPVHGRKAERHVQTLLDPDSRSRSVSIVDEVEKTSKTKFLLSAEQKRILDAVVEEGKSVFFTGSAGTGKSVLLREIIDALKEKYRKSENAVVVTASTGLAAFNIGGTTIHWFAGIGTGAEPANVLINKLFKNPQARTRWRKAQVLIIDEVSMLDGKLFDKLNEIAIAIRQNVTKEKPELKGRPFAGLQLVITGDFFQLPPVTKFGENTVFAFESRVWRQCLDETYNLTKVFRQKDEKFVAMLNEMRFGKLSPSSIALFKSLSRPVQYNDNILPTELFALRREVDQSNYAKLQALQGADLVTFVAEDWSSEAHKGPKDRYMPQLNSFLAPPKLEIKEGAQVMLIKNLEDGLVNGTVGRVISFGAPDGFDLRDDLLRKRAKAGFEKNIGKDPFVEWSTPNGIERRLVFPEEFRIEDAQGLKLAHRRQYPLILAWAMSIHKSQGQTIPRIKVDLGRVFEAGQSYVALSRAKSLDALQVLNFDPKKVTSHPKVAAWHRTLKELREEDE